MPTVNDLSIRNNDVSQAIIGSATWGSEPIPREWINPEWSRREPDWRLFRLCYVGGREFIESRNPATLFSHEREPAASYAWRRARASYRNHCEAIVGLKADAIYQPQVLRGQGKGADDGESDEDAAPVIKRAQAEDPTFEPFLLDVDLRGTNADPFMNEVARWAMVYGRHWIGIAMTPAPELVARASAEGRAISEAEARAAEVRPYYYHLSPLSVIDWGTDDCGRLTYAVVLGYESNRVPLGKQMPRRLVARILYPDREERFAIGAQGKLTPLGPPAPHPFGEVPLVPVCVRADGRSQLEDIARAAIAVYNHDSMVDEQVYRQTFNQLVFSGIKDPAAFMESVKGTDSVLALPEGATAFYLAPNVATISAIQTTAWEKIDEMWATANLRSRPGGKGSQPATDTSGIAFAFENKNAETDLCSIATRLEEAELKLGVMRARALGLDESGFTVQYPREFDVRALLARANEAQQLKAAGLGPKAMAEVLKNLARKALPRLPAGRLAEIDAEIDAAAKAADKAPEVPPPPPPNQNMQPPGMGAGQDRMERDARPPLKVGEAVTVKGAA